MLDQQAKKEKAREAKESQMWADWVDKTQKQLTVDSGEKGEGDLIKEGSWTPHPPVQSIPDNDWQGETWGLYFQDIDWDEILVRRDCLVSWFLLHCVRPTCSLY